ncbi:MAG: phosphate signaling complex protein PhoU [Oscillospiraceae bacterium]|nr:phosphate signaling complex protein PhoU [Oscillospiraceae bacterium]
MRNMFDDQLNDLHRKLIEMGSACETAIDLAVKALLEGDRSIAHEAAAHDQQIDHMERQIEAICLKMLLQQQPVARDLRQISAAMKIITDMERIGDQAEDIGEIVPFLKGRTGLECQDIRLMAETAQQMVRFAVDAYVDQDMALVKKVITMDDIVDDAFDRTKETLIRMITDNREDGEYALDLLMIAKYLERIGDHATNIAEWVEFSITGTHTNEG